MELVKAPALILTRNPAEVVFKISSALKTEGSYARGVMRLDTSNWPVASDTLLFAFGDYSLTFEFSSGTGIGTDPLKLSVPSMDQAGFELFLQQLYRHPDIAKFYTVEIVGDPSTDFAFQMRARNRGADYTLTTTLTGTIAWLAENQVAGVDDELYSSIELLMRVYDNDEVDLLGELTGTGIVDADSNQMRVTFHDLPALLDNYLAFDIPVEANEIHYSNILNYFHLELYQKTEDTLTPMQVEFYGDFPVMGNSLAAIKAGFPLENFSATAFDLFTAATGRKFLSWQPRTGKLITYEQPEWLSIYLPTEGAYRKKFTIYYSDNSNDTLYVNFTPTEPGILHIPSGAQQNDLNSLHSTKTIVWFEFSVQLIAGTVNISEVFPYVIDTRFQRYNRYFVFANSLGGCDTVRCFGVKDFTRAFTRTTTDTAIDSDSRMTTGSMEMVYNELEQTFTMRSGWQQDRATVDYYTDLLRSNSIKEIIMPLKASQYLQPQKQVIVLNDKVNYPNDAEFGYAIEFSLKYGWKDTQYSNLVSDAELYYDSELEFTVNVTALLSGSKTFNLIVNGGCVVYAEVNGVPKTFVSNVLTITATGIYHFKIKAYNLTYFEFSTTHATADIVFTNIDSRTIVDFLVYASHKMNLHYLITKLTRLRFVEQLAIGIGVSVDNDKDILMFFCQRLYDTYGRLTTVDFSTVTGSLSPEGGAAKAYLISEGLSVTAT